MHRECNNEQSRQKWLLSRASMLALKSTLHHPDAQMFNKYLQVLLLEKRNNRGKGKEGDKLLCSRARPSERHRTLYLLLVSLESSLTDLYNPLLMLCTKEFRRCNNSVTAGIYWF